MIDRFISTHGLTTRVLLTASIVCCLPATHIRAGDDRPSFSAIEKIVVQRLAEKKEYQPGDVISRTDVKIVFEDLGTAGWQPRDRKKIEEDLLDDGSSLVRTFKNAEGRRFMRKVADYGLIFDRLDRVSRVSGGERMLQDLVKLPDGEKYAKKKTPNGVPDMLDLLPKSASGKKRSIKDYDKPTGRIYTEADLLKRLKRSYAGPAETDDAK